MQWIVLDDKQGINHHYHFVITNEFIQNYHFIKKLIVYIMISKSMINILKFKTKNCKTRMLLSFFSKMLCIPLEKLINGEKDDVEIWQINVFMVSKRYAINGAVKKSATWHLSQK